MLQTFRKTLGLPIREVIQKNVFGIVRDIIVNPNNGLILALAVAPGQKVLPVQDIQKITRKAILVADQEALAEPGDIVRIAEVLRLQTPILRNKVFTVSGQFLGRVIDFEFQTKGMLLTKINVAKKFLFFKLESKIISQQQIITIKPTKIIVRDAKIPAAAVLSKKDSQLKLVNAALQEE